MGVYGLEPLQELIGADRPAQDSRRQTTMRLQSSDSFNYYL